MKQKVVSFFILSWYNILINKHKGGLKMQQDKIEIVDKDLGRKTVYKLYKDVPLDKDVDEEEYIDTPLTNFLRFSFKLCKFSAYAALTSIELLIKLIKTIFNLNDYKPFKPITDFYYNHMDKRTLNYFKKQSYGNAVRTHKYEFIRSRVFAKNYLLIDKLLTNVYKNNVELNEDIYKDIMARIDILICESERQSFAESYKYAKETHYNFESQYAFDRYVKDRIMKGVDYRETNKELLETIKNRNNQ